MMAVLRSLLIAGAAAGVAALVGRFFRGALLGSPKGPFTRGMARYPLLVLTTLAFIYLGYAAPWLSVTGLVAALVFSLLRIRAEVGSLPVVPKDKGRASRPFWARRWHLDAPRALALLFALVLLGVCLLRPPLPLYWDEFVWLGKARLGAQSPALLWSEALKPGSTRVLPAGYPLFYPLAVACLAGFRAGPVDVTAAAAVMELIIYLLFLAALWDSAHRARMTRPHAVLPAASAFFPWVVLLLTPLVIIHLRSVYVDLPIGVLAATLFLLVRRPGAPMGPAVVAVILVGLKDEGFVHVVAVTAVAALEARLAGRRRGWLVPAVTLGVALAVFAAWRAQLARAEVTGLDHAMGLPHLDRALPVAILLVRDLTDMTTWGALWMLTLGAGIALGWSHRRMSGTTIAVAATLIVQAAFLFGAVLSGPHRVFEFAMNGTLMNRLLVQLAPMAALFVGAMCREALRAAAPSVPRHASLRGENP